MEEPTASRNRPYRGAEFTNSLWSSYPDSLQFEDIRNKHRRIERYLPRHTSKKKAYGKGYTTAIIVVLLAIAALSIMNLTISYDDYTTITKSKPQHVVSSSHSATNPAKHDTSEPTQVNRLAKSERPAKQSIKQSDQHGVKLSGLPYPATLESQIIRADGDSWQEPVDIAMQGPAESYFVDYTNNDLYAFSFNPRMIKKLNLTEPLNSPSAIDVHNHAVYIADAGASRIAKVDRGKVESISIPAGSTAARPAGIRVLDNNNILVSDADNHRVIELHSDGSVAFTIGSGKKESTNAGFNTPGSLAIDGQGNIYVVDTLNARIQKFDGNGTYVASFGGLGDTAGTLMRPKGVAVDVKGNIFVSDGMQCAVSVFAPDGKFLGYIGLTNEAGKSSKSMFSAIAGIKIYDGKLYVADRFKGLYVFALP